MAVHESQRAPQRRDLRRVWRILRPFLIIAISIAVLCVALSIGYEYVMDHYIRPVDAADDTPVEVEIPRGSGPSSIASVLYGDGDEGLLIRSKTAFKIYIDFSGKRSKLRAGSYTFSRNMSIVEIVNKLASGEGSNSQEVVTVRLTEGMTVRDMADMLEAKGAIKSAADFEAICQHAEGFENFILAVESDRQEGRVYALEGYLFPDTYKFYRGDGDRNVINKMLARFNEVVTGEDVERAEELGMTIDQIVTLASIIEKEAKTQDFARVSAVLHNRLRQNIALRSDATVIYTLGTTNLYLNETQLKTDTPYNTHLYKGLPVGPICNPGKAAIIAALNPDPLYVAENYLYFTLKGPESGELVFTKTAEEHLKETEKYVEQWKEYDERNRQAQDQNQTP